MDPITAISIASAAVAFFDFAFGLIKDFKQIEEQGQTLTAQSFESSTKTMKSYTCVLRKRQRMDDGSHSPLTEHERALDELLNECGDTAQELLNLLSSLKPKEDSSKLRSIAKVFKTWGKRDELEQLKNHLDECRKNLPIRLLAYLNAKIDSNDAQTRKDFSIVHDSGREIVQMLIIHHDDLINRLSKQDKRLTHLEAQSKSGLIDAILTFRDGDKETLSSGIMGSGTNLQRLENPRDFRRIGKAINTVAGNSSEAASSYYVDFDRIQQRILDCLSFRHINDRAGSIEAAHKKTFEWVFRSPSDRSPLWSDFPKWLKQEETGCYWINGKAASGKSTLMRFIKDDPRLLENLQDWAGNLPLITASFFFWFLGNPLQKSRIGLLRSLLFDILSQRPELILQVMPELCREAGKGGYLHQEIPADPTIEELTRWFRRLKAATEGRYRVFIQLDGLDEFEDKHQILLNMLEEMYLDTSSIKVLVSSRPITDYTQALSQFPSLQLQDLTRGDIRQYTEDHLLNKRYGDPEWTTVIDTVVKKSFGVFLWVTLVVQSLLEGLRNGDTIGELQLRLDELPSEIENLYQTMVNRIPPKYRENAAKMIRLVVLNQQGQDGGQFFTPLTTLHISFSLESWDSVLNYPCQPISEQEIISRHTSIEARLRSRCLGLIEVRSGSEGFLESCEDNVGFIHKTAFEFLEDGTNYSILEAQTRSIDFNPHASLFGSCILLAKTDQPAEVIDCQILGERDWSKSDGARTWPQLRSAFCLATLSESTGRPLDSKYLFEYDNALQRSWNSAGYWIRHQIRDVHGDIKKTEITGHWSNILVFPSLIRPHQQSKKPDVLIFGQPDAVTRRSRGAIPQVTLHREMTHSIMEFSNEKGLSLVCVLFSLPTMLQTVLQNGSIRAGQILQTSESDVTRLLECFIYRVLLLDFLGPGFSICSELDVKIARSLVRAGADPSYCPTMVQIDSNSSASDFSILTLLLFLLAGKIQNPDDVSMIDSDNVEQFVTELITDGTDLEAIINFANGSFAPEHMVQFSLDYLRSQTGTEKRDTVQLCAALERLQNMMQSRCVNRNSQPHNETKESSPFTMRKLWRSFRPGKTGR